MFKVTSIKDSKVSQVEIETLEELDMVLYHFCDNEPDQIKRFWMKGYCMMHQNDNPTLENIQDRCRSAQYEVKRLFVNFSTAIMVFEV